MNDGTTSDKNSYHLSNNNENNNKNMDATTRDKNPYHALSNNIDDLLSFKKYNYNNDQIPDIDDLKDNNDQIPDIDNLKDNNDQIVSFKNLKKNYMDTKNIRCGCILYQNLINNQKNDNMDTNIKNITLPSLSLKEYNTT